MPVPRRHGRRVVVAARRPVGRARRVDRVRDRHRRRARRRGPRRSTQVLIDLDGGWWWLPADHRRDDRPAGGLRRPGRARRRRARSRSGAALDRLAARRPAPGRVHRAPRPVRRGRHGPGAARGGRPRLHRLRRRRLGASAWTRRSSSGSCRGLGLPVVDWREVRAGALGGATRARSSRELEAFAAGTRRPAADGQAGAARQLGRDDPRPRPRRARRPRSTTAFRYDTLALVEAYLAGARDLEVSVIGNDPARLELYGPGEIVAGHEFYDYAAKYTPGPVRDVDRAPRSPTRSAPTILKIARDAYRAIGAEGFARVDFLLARRASLPVRDQHDPGLHPDQPLPDDAGRGRLRLRRRLPPDRRAGARAARRAGRPPAHRRPTCRDERWHARPAAAGPRPRPPAR